MASYIQRYQEHWYEDRSYIETVRFVIRFINCSQIVVILNTINLYHFLHIDGGMIVIGV